jgi:hypothetical protein
MMLRTKTPQAMNVTHPGSINLAATTYTVNVTNGNGVLATITDANHNILGSATVSNGTANITLTAPGQIQDLTLCVFGYNKVTYLGNISVVGGAQYTITCNQPEHGNISAPEMAYGSQTVTLTATPETGYCLSSWDVRDANNTPITVTNNTFVMPESNVTVNATFEEGLAITMASVMNGTISADPNYALQGTTVNLTATPATGYNFNSWIVYKTSDVNTTVAVTDNSFTMPNYPVTVSAIFLAPQGGDVTIGSGTSTNSYIPTYSYYKYSLVQQIYTSAEMGEAGTITKVAFKVSNSKSTTRSIDIYLSHTSTSSFSSNSGWISQSTSYRVFSGDVDFLASGWTTITLNTPFEYDGTSNLLLTVDDNTGSYVSSSSDSPTFYVYSANSNTAIYKYNDYTNYNPASMSTSGTRLQTKNQVVFTKEVPSTEGYLTVSPNALDFTYAEGEGPSEAQGVALIGANLQGNVTVAMPTGYEVSSNGSTYASTLNLTPANGSLQQMIYVRLAAGLNQGSYDGTMTLTSGTTTQSITLSGEVTEGSGSGIHEQTSTLAVGWNWWTPNVDLDAATLLAQLKESLGTNGIKIISPEGRFLSYNASTNIWSGNLFGIEVGKMYKIDMSSSCEITLTGPAIDEIDNSITIYPGNNWIGFFGTESMSVNQAMSNFTPTQGDKIIFNNKFSTYNGSSWVGTLSQLVPGNGYIYKSNATESQTLIFNSAK